MSPRAVVLLHVSSRRAKLLMRFIYLLSNTVSRSHDCKCKPFALNSSCAGCAVQRRVYHHHDRSGKSVAGERSTFTSFPTYLNSFKPVHTLVAFHGAPSH